MPVSIMLKVKVVLGRRHVFQQQKCCSGWWPKEVCFRFLWIPWRTWKKHCLQMTCTSRFFPLVFTGHKIISGCHPSAWCFHSYLSFLLFYHLSSVLSVLLILSPLFPFPYAELRVYNNLTNRYQALWFLANQRTVCTPPTFRNHNKNKARPHMLDFARTRTAKAFKNYHSTAHSND